VAGAPFRPSSRAGGRRRPGRRRAGWVSRRSRSVCRSSCHRWGGSAVYARKRSRSISRPGAKQSRRSCASSMAVVNPDLRPVPGKLRPALNRKNRHRQPGSVQRREDRRPRRPKSATTRPLPPPRRTSARRVLRPQRVERARAVGVAAPPDRPPLWMTGRSGRGWLGERQEVFSFSPQPDRGGSFGSHAASDPICQILVRPIANEPDWRKQRGSGSLVTAAAIATCVTKRTLRQGCPRKRKRDH
jgi:hypothetical protein